VARWEVAFAVRIGSTAMQPVSGVRDLWIMLDAEVTMSTKQVARHCDGSIACGVRYHVMPWLTLIQALVVSKVDYCNSVLASMSGTLLRRLQSVLNAASRLVFSARKSEHITVLLCELHWLRIKFRLCVLAFQCLHGTAPRYLAETLHLTTSHSSCSCLHSAAMSTLIVPAARRRTRVTMCFSAIFRQRSTVTGSLSTTTEDSTFQDILLQGC